MKTYSIVIGQSVGDIIFGMTRNDARQLLGDYREFKNSQVEMNSFDQFAFCQLGYDNNDKVEFVCFHTLKDIEVKLGDKVISSMSALELFSYINKLDKITELEEDGISFESDVLGIAAYFEKTPVITQNTNEEIVCEKLESITIAVPGYWSKYKA